MSTNIVRLLHIIRSVNPAGGGPVEGIIQIAKANPAHFNVIVASLDDPEAEYCKKFPLTLYALGGKFQPKYGFSKKFKQWLNGFIDNIDIVIINGIWQYHSIAACNVLTKRDFPFLVYPHGMLDPWFNKKYPLKHIKKFFYWKLFENKVLKNARAVLFTAEEERHRAGLSFKPYVCNQIVVGYGTGKVFSDMDSRKIEVNNQILDRFPDLKNKKIILFIGRITPKKGCDLLIKSFIKIFQKYPDYALLMAGPSSASYYKKLSKLTKNNEISHRIVYTGMVTGTMKEACYKVAEVFVLPSHQENFGLTVAESLSCGVPVLISNKVNIYNEIVAGNAGYAEDDTVEGTTALLAKWIGSSPEVKNKMKESAVNLFEKNYNIYNTSTKLRSVIEKYKKARG